MGELTAKVYKGSSPTTLVADLTDSFGESWLDVYNDTGSGQVQIAKDHPAITATGRRVLLDNNIVRCSIGGVETFAFIVKGSDKPPAPTDEDAGEVWTLKGAGVLSILQNAPVMPEREGTNPTDRSFGWMAMAYDDNPWDNAVQIQRQNDTAGTVTPHWVRYPNDWPDPLAYWIWSSAAAGSAPFMAVGKSYFRTHFTLANDTIVRIHATCDDGMRFFFDDEELFDNITADVGSFGFHDTQTEDRVLKAGYHVIAVEALNMNWTPSSNYAGFLCSVIELDPGHGIPKPMNVIVRSGAAWKAMDYPADPPGMTPGLILRLLLEQAQDDGYLVGVTLGCTDDKDAKAVDWAVIPDIAFPIGTNYLDVIRTLVEQYIDIEMTPDLVLKPYAKGTLGFDRTADVALVVGEDIDGKKYFESLDSQRSGPVANVLIVRDATGTLTTHIGTIGPDDVKIARYEELGTAPSTAQATRTAIALLEAKSVPTVFLPGKVTEESGVYDTWTRGDTILAPGQMGDLVPTRVLSIAPSEDDAGNAVFEVEFMQEDSLAVGS